MRPQQLRPQQWHGVDEVAACSSLSGAYSEGEGGAGFTDAETGVQVDSEAAAAAAAGRLRRCWGAGTLPLRDARLPNSKVNLSCKPSDCMGSRRSLATTWRFEQNGENVPFHCSVRLCKPCLCSRDPCTMQQRSGWLIANVRARGTHGVNELPNSDRRTCHGLISTTPGYHVEHPASANYL